MGILGVWANVHMNIILRLKPWALGFKGLGVRV